MPISTARRPILVVLLVLPWLWPFTSGPRAGTQPLLVSMAAAALLLALWPTRGERAAALQWIVPGWVLAAAISGALALLQYFDLEAPLYPWVNQSEPGRAFANLRQPNQLATLLVIGLLALRTWSQTRAPARRWVGPLAALLVTALAATVSRVGAVELLAIAALVLAWARAGGRWRAPLRPILTLGLGYLLAIIALPWMAQQIGPGVHAGSLLERLRTGDSLCGGRLTLWGNVLHLIALKPWTGWGWGELAWAHYMTLYDGPRFCAILDNAHNLPLHLAVELGLPVALLTCGALAWVVWRARPWREQAPERQLAWGVLLAVAVHSLVEYPLWYGPFQIAVAVCLWLLWRAGPATPARWFASRAGGLRLGATAVLLAAVGYAAWDYRIVSQVYLPKEQRAAAHRSEPLAAARRSWLFADAVRFAELTTHEVKPDNAAWMLTTGEQLLHYSPEPRVITRVIESAHLLGRDDLARAHAERLRAAFTDDWRRWATDHAPLLQEIGAAGRGGDRGLADPGRSMPGPGR